VKNITGSIFIPHELSAMKKLLISLLLSVTLASYVPVSACTTFLLEKNGKYVFGRNYDWVTGNGMVCTNLRGLAKTSSPDRNGGTIDWVSRYGSITFNQYGKEFPMGGMNEKGLVVELMWLDGTKYPAADNRPAVDVLQWIQYQLDNCSTVEEIIDTDKRLRIGNGNPPLHYLVADANGKAATIEFLDGKMVVHQGSDLPFPVLTNDRYSFSLNETKNAIKATGNPARSFTNNSIDRFAKACSMVEQFRNNSGQAPVPYAFDILEAVTQGSHTKWSIVYDISGRTVSFRTHENREIRKVSFAAFDFNCNSTALAWPMEQEAKGDISKLFVPWTQTMNKELVETSYRESQSQLSVPESAVKETWTYAGKISCDK
jgi:choloylglycine hydrolase